MASMLTPEISDPAVIAAAALFGFGLGMGLVATTAVVKWINRNMNDDK